MIFGKDTLCLIEDFEGPKLNTPLVPFVCWLYSGHCLMKLGAITWPKSERRRNPNGSE